MISRKRSQKGNAAVFTLILALVCILVLLALFDLCRLFIAREEAKTISDSIALAAAQELIYFYPENIILIAGEIAESGGCSLISLHTGYDVVEVIVEKETQISLLDRIGLDSLKTIKSGSRVKVIYPWDRRLGQCNYYEFGYKPY